MSLRRSTKEMRSAVSNNYIVFLQEHEVDIEVMEDDLINFYQVMESFNSHKYIDVNEEIKPIKNNGIWDLISLLKSAKHISCN